MADERYFTRLNSYKVKDSTAWEEIEKLKTAKADVTNVEELVNAVNTRVASAETSISELNTRFNYLHIPDSANEISFSSSGITATDVQNAVVEVNTKVTQNTSDIAELTSLINGIEIPEAVKEVVTGTTGLTNGVSELANDTLYVEYETGETGTSVKNLYVGINGRAVKITTGSSSSGGSGSEGGGTIVPSSVELTLYGGSGETVTLTKGEETVATITLGSDGSTTYTLEGTADEVYTFTGGLSGRTATYTYGVSETNIYLRPKRYFYWYGLWNIEYIKSSHANGSTMVNNYTNYTSVTFEPTSAGNTGYIQLNSSELVELNGESTYKLKGSFQAGFANAYGIVTLNVSSKAGGISEITKTATTGKIVHGANVDLMIDITSVARFAPNLKVENQYYESSNPRVELRMKEWYIE